MTKELHDQVYRIAHLDQPERQALLDTLTKADRFQAEAYLRGWDNAKPINRSHWEPKP